MFKTCRFHALSLFTARQEKENQERNKDPGKSAGWPKYHLTVRYRQGSRGNFDFPSRTTTV